MMNHLITRGFSRFYGCKFGLEVHCKKVTSHNPVSWYDVPVLGRPGQMPRVARFFFARMQGWLSQSQDTTATMPKYFREGPLAHLVEQGTFNPKVPGSSPGRPTRSEL